MSHKSVLSLTVDREGCLWVGTNGGGLIRVRRKLFDVLERSRGSVVQSVCEDGQGGLWIGYTGNRVDHYTGSGTQRFRLIPGSLPVDVNPDTAAGCEVGVCGARSRARSAATGCSAGPGVRRGRTLFQLEYGQFAPLDLPEALDWKVSAIFQDRAGRLVAGHPGRVACGWTT